MDISSSHLNHTTLEQRKQGFGYQKTLYALVAIELIVALLFTSFSLYWWAALGSELAKWWYFGVIAAALVVLLILIAFFVSQVRILPINWIIYGVFTLAFADLAAFLNCLDPSNLLYFSLWSLTVIISGFALYSICSSSYIPVIESFLISFGLGALVLMAFIVFTALRLQWLIVVSIGTAVFGFYYAYGLRTATRFSNFDEHEEDPISGAVRFWLDGLLVGCRFFEMFGQSFKERE